MRETQLEVSVNLANALVEKKPSDRVDETKEDAKNDGNFWTENSLLNTSRSPVASH